MLRRSRSTMRLDSAEPMSPIPARINHPRARRSGEGNPVGLKIVIDGSSLDTNVVIKSSLRSPPPKPVGVEGFLPCSLPELSFLKACFLCKKQLSPEKDVYIYSDIRHAKGGCCVGGVDSEKLTHPHTLSVKITGGGGRLCFRIPKRNCPGHGVYAEFPFVPLTS
ncbi:uncharacterized protein LOC116264508 isoform X1 [Nymphaea colorata]|nr:uncharacterized protein LOC116264508 isoform X1 [Nymphaea colorata]